MAFRRALVAALVVVFAVALAPSASAKISTLKAREGNALGIIPIHGVQDPAAGSQTPVVYHGGPVMSGGVTVHLIFWKPTGFQYHDANYESDIVGFFNDVAADSGTTTNIFSVLPQFGDSNGPGQYNISVDTINDANDFPTTDNCASVNGIPTCLTDHQVQAEVDHVIQTSGGTLHRGLSDLYMVYLPQDVDTCILPGACATNAFGGYHSLSDLGHGTTIYANLPDPEVEETLPDDATFPNGNPDAEIQMDVSGHETVEAMTDPLGTGWMDPNGFEVADKCEFGPVVGPILGQAANGADFNQEINSSDFLLQEMWSNDDGGCVQRTTQTASPLPLAQVNMNQFSTTVSGNIGSNHAVNVDVDLIRAGTLVSSASTTSSASDGSWTVSLSHAVGDDRDIIGVSYNQGQTGAPPDAEILTGNGGNPFEEAGWTGWGDLDTATAITSDGNDVLYFPCFQTGVSTLNLNSGSQPTGACDTETDSSDTAVGSPITNADTVTLSTNDNRGFSADNLNGGLVDLTVPVGEPDSSTPDGFLGGFPVCSANLELGRASCSGLVPGDHYTLTRSRGGTVAGANADGSGELTAAFSGSPALTGGDTVTLRNSASRVLSTLHVAHLRVDLTGEQTTVSGGTCEASDYYGPFTIGPSTSSSAGVLDPPGGPGPAGSGTICPPNGRAAGLDATDIEQTDDRSGGQTKTEVPDVEDTSPLEAETVYGAFTALADPGLPGASNSVLAVPDAVSLSIAPQSGGAPVFTSSNVNKSSGVAVPALTPGTYRATWVVTDANGDTRTVTTRFVEQPANAGPQGTQGPPGPPGPKGDRGSRGPRGKSVKVSCKLKGKKIHCKVRSASAKTATVRAMLSRGSRIAAIGHGRIRHGRASLTLRTVGRVRRGRARITLVIATSRHGATTITQAVRLR